MPLGSIGKYEKLDVLGHGASGIVYLAWDSLLGKHVAIKEISLLAADEARFLEEARVLDRLRHPNIVQVNGVDRIDSHLIIDMEYVKGTNLHEYQRRKGKLPAREALSVAVQICDALDFAHRNRTVHRDIKPANVLISQEGVAKIGDFGLAEILGSGSYAGGAGTYAYMAPEDFDEEDSSDFRSDIWAIGVTVYEMLVGRRPFQAAKPKDPFSWKRTVEEDRPAPLSRTDPTLPRELDEIIEKALAKDKHDRYQSAGELRDDLSDVLKALGGPIAIAGAVSPTRKRAEREIMYSPSVRGNAVVETSPEALDFGRLRRDDSARRNLTVQVPGRGRIAGRVVSQPGWISVQPQAFTRRKQRLTVTAATESIFRPDTYNDRLVLEVDGETVHVPLTLEVLPRRRRFLEVAWWFLPLSFLCLLPLLVRPGGAFGLGPNIDSAAVVTSGFLCAMLVLVAIMADLGILEKLCPAIAAAIQLGAVAGVVHQGITGGGFSHVQDLSRVSISGSLLSLIFAFQWLTASKWKFWAAFISGCSLLSAHLLSR